MATELQQKQRKMAFAKLQIKGGISCLASSATQLGLTDSKYTDLLKTIHKLEQTMLNQLAEHWEVTKCELGYKQKNLDKAVKLLTQATSKKIIARQAGGFLRS